MSDSSAVRVMRRRATAAGLRLILRNDLYLLVDANDDVLVSSRSLDELRQVLPPRRPGTRPLGAPAGWTPVIDEWYRHMIAAGIRPASRDTWRRTVNRMARELPAGTPSEVTASMLLEFFASNPHWKPDTRGIYRTSARKFFRWCHRHGYVSWFLTDEDLPARPKGAPLALPVPDDVWCESIAAAPPRVQVMMRLAGEAGLRRSEVAQVHTDHLIEGPNGADLIVEGKGGKTRRIPVTDSLAAVIRAGARGHTPDMPATGWLFPSSWNQSKPLTPIYVGEIVADALPQGWSMHKLRHRFATRAFRGSRNIRAVQELLGHSSVATTQRYTATDSDELRAAAMAAAFSEDEPR